jgi:hypothetical protein
MTELSKSAPRALIHDRDIRCRGYRRDDGLWDIEGTLEDTKAYSFDNEDRGGIAAGEPIHRMRIRLTLDDDLRVCGAEAVTAAGPFSICGAIAPVFASLHGLVIGRGWRRAVLERMAGVHGCTHLTELLLGPMTTTALQTVRAARARRHGKREDGQEGAQRAQAPRPAILDTCHALAATGPIVKREWPDFYEGEE